MTTLLLRATLVWLGLMILAILNGAFRQGVLNPRLGEPIGHVVSTMLLCLLILATTWVTLPWILPSPAATSTDAWVNGFFWLVLTLGFEFLAGHFLFKTPWAKLFADYDVLHGRVWMLVLVTTLLAPIIVRPMQAR